MLNKPLSNPCNYLLPCSELVLGSSCRLYFETSLRLMYLGIPRGVFPRHFNTNTLNLFILSPRVLHILSCYYSPLLSLLPLLLLLFLFSFLFLFFFSSPRLSLPLILILLLFLPLSPPPISPFFSSLFNFPFSSSLLLLLPVTLSSLFNSSFFYFSPPLHIYSLSLLIILILLSGPPFLPSLPVLYLPSYPTLLFLLFCPSVPPVLLLFLSKLATSTATSSPTNC